MSKTTNKRVVISTWQSIYQQPKKWFEQFGMIIGDEAHLFKAVSLDKDYEQIRKLQIQSWFNRHIRWF